MTYLQRKKLAFMSIVNQVKGFVRTISGIPPLTLPNCFDNNSLIDYSISGNIGGVGDKTENLLDMDSYVQKTGYTIDDTTGDLKWKGSRQAVETFINVEPGTNYVLWGKSISTTYNEIHIYGYDNEQNYIGKIVGGYKNKLTFTTPDNCQYIRFYYSQTHLENLQLKLGSVVGEYEPYGYKIPIICSGKNLYDHATIKDKKDTTTTGYPKYKIFLPNGVYTWSLEENKFLNSGGYAVWTDQPDYNGSLADGYFRDWIGSSTTPYNCKTRGTVTVTRGYVYLSVLYLGFDFLSSMQLEYGDKETAYEPYAEPTTTTIYLDEPLTEGKTITYTEDNLPVLPTIKGTAIYSVDTTTQPSNMEITYYSTQKG